MKRRCLYIIGTIFALVAAGCMGNQSEASADCAKTSVRHERKVGVQMFTFYKFTFEDSVAKLKAADATNVGLTRGQKLSAKYNTNISPELDAEARAHLKKLVKNNNLEIASYGVITPKSETEIEDVCIFAKEIGIPVILTESPASLLPAWQKACEKYDLKMAIHNHAVNSKNNNYYKPEVVRDLVKPYSRIYACPDNGHWSRSGLDPVAGYKTLEGKIAIVHFKDQKKFNDLKSPCVPFGEGVLDMKAMLAELDRQKFDGCFLIEYEADFDNNTAQVKKCVDYLKNN